MYTGDRPLLNNGLPASCPRDLTEENAGGALLHEAQPRVLVQVLEYPVETRGVLVDGSGHLIYQAGWKYFLLRPGQARCNYQTGAGDPLQKFTGFIINTSGIGYTPIKG